MDIKQQSEKIANKIQKDSALQSQFKKDPIKAVEKLLGADLPADVIEKVVAGVKTKLSLDDLSDAVDALKKLF